MNMAEPYVHQLFTGKVKTLGSEQAQDPLDRVWRTGMFKEPKSGAVFLGTEGLLGDEVADTKHHGGPEKAVFAYPIRHYTYWNETEGMEMAYGGMGENLAVLEMDEFTVCIGDVYRFGEAVIQVSQPRQPCWKPARRYRQKELALKIQKTGRTGWYFRVLEEGEVQGETDLELLERPCPNWTIAACNEVMHVYKDNLRLTDDLAACELLAPSWRETLKKRLRGLEADLAKRVYGPNG